MKLDPSRFDDWFRALNNLPPGQGPFPWQRRLFREWLCPAEPDRARWPRLMRLPTAGGKTAILDLAVLALAVGSPCARRRLVFVVDRRVVVDEAALRAKAIAGRLGQALGRSDDPLHEVARSLASLGGEKPLVVATLRGGIPEDDVWARSPVQPAVLLSTVDQTGSRLLFRAYGGHGPRSWPIYAGLLGRDSVIIIDEAHCAVPFCDTAQAIAERFQDFAECPVGEKLAVVRMSATPAEDADFQLEAEDRSNQVLDRRLRASKPAELMLVQTGRDGDRCALVEAMVKRAHALLGSMPKGVVAIAINRVADARAAFERIELPLDRKILLTGRVRGWERDRLLERWLPRLRAGSREEAEEPLAVVATQCIEVGANLDFDALVTEVAPLDALRQRFGRLNRLGDRDSAPGVIVATSQQIKTDEQRNAKFPDQVYGHALSRTWDWLNQHAQGKPPCVDFGIDALEAILPDSQDLSALCQEARRAYVLLPAHLNLLAQTSPPPQPDPEISAFLHGTTEGSPDVTVVWRCDVPEKKPELWRDRVAVQPPATGEGCPVPVWEFRAWLGGKLAEDTGDREAVQAPDEAAGGGKRALRWRGADEAEIVRAGEVRPGDVVVVPSRYGGCDEFGWNPASEREVTDIGDAVAFTAGRRPTLRLETLKSVLSSFGDEEGLTRACEELEKWAAGQDDAPDAADLLTRLAETPAIPDWLRRLARILAEDGRRRAVETDGSYAIVGRQSSGEDLSTVEDGSSVCVPVGLAEHSAGVRHYAERFARAAGLPESLVSDLGLAGWLHDVGKADPRFQVWLHGGDELAAALAAAPLAKSGQNPRNRAAIRRAREQAGYPEGGRHEVQSLALIGAREELRKQANDWDLVQHLVVSHHGFGRPFVPAIDDPDTVPVVVQHGELRLEGTSDHRLHRIDSGIAERYWRLVRRYGWWGLAWLEAILRLADHRRSQHEERGEVNGD